MWVVIRFEIRGRFFQMSVVFKYHDFPDFLGTLDYSDFQVFFSNIMIFWNMFPPLLPLVAHSPQKVQQHLGTGASRLPSEQAETSKM